MPCSKLLGSKISKRESGTMFALVSTHTLDDLNAQGSLQTLPRLRLNLIALYAIRLQSFYHSTYQLTIKKFHPARSVEPP